MKITIFTKIIFILISVRMVAIADAKWIPLQSMEDSQSKKKNSALDINFSQIAPMNNMLKNATLIKQLLDARSKEEKVVTQDKNWFIIKE